MRKLAFLFYIAVFVPACSHKNKIPAGILPKEKMEAVLWDLVRAGEFLEGYVFTRDTAIDKAATGVEWYENIYRLHKTNKATFEKSYAYYRDHPALMKEVLDSLNKKQITPSGPPGQKAAGADSTAAGDTQNKKGGLLSGKIADSLKSGKKQLRIR
jgi:Domain of unknown function (DUF4296)